MSALSDRIRIEWAAGDMVRDAGLKTPEDIVRFNDIAYGPVSKWNTLDVYRPKDAEGLLPVIVNVHGGGWVYGDKELYQFYAMSLAQRGFAVVNFSYRLAPENKYPAPLEDINAVIAWMFDHAGEYGLKMDKVFMVGDSAGGHLAGLYSAICTNGECAKNYAFKVPNGFVPTALGLNCGVYVPAKRQSADGSNTDDLARDFLPDGGTEDELDQIDVTRYVTEKFPPSFIMSAVGDFCLAQVGYLVEAMIRAKVPFVSKIYGDKSMPLYHVFHVNMREETGRLCNDEECEFFRRYL